jgi:glycine cleavage system aminomethyltransferase T
MITQAIISPYLGGSTLGLAKVDKDAAVAGTPVEARFAGGTAHGEVVAHPVYEPGRERAKKS